MSDQNYQDPYAAQQQPQQQWGAQPGQGGVVDAYAVAPQQHPQAQTTFILGIVGIFVGICSFIAWYMGGKAKKEIEAGAPYEWGGNLKTGYLLGKIFGILYIVGTVLYIIFLIVMFAVIGTSNN